jgi:hypothetical protein
MSDDEALWKDVSVFRPSYSATWLSCSGSLLPSRNARDAAGEDAAIGTVFHLVMSEWLTEGRPDSWLGQTFEIEKEDRSEIFQVVVDEEMFAYGKDCLDYIANIPGDRYVETLVDISSITPIPDQGGTCDLAICQPGILDITDWKYGRGVQVFVERNSQLLLYAWGFFNEYDEKYDFQIIRLRIAQPRLNHWDESEITREELIEWAAWAKERAHAAWKRNADRSPSPKACQWCKVRVDCPALEAVRQALADQSFDAIDEPVTEAQMKAIVAAGSPPPRQLPDPVTMPTEQLAQIQRYRKLMEKWFAQGAEELITRALQGEQLSDWKIVEGRSRRRWRDEELAGEKLGLLGLGDDEIHERKLVSPAKAEKLLRPMGVGGRLLTDFMRTIAEKPIGKPTLAPDGDNRLSIPNPVDDSFDVEEDEAAL